MKKSSCLAASAALLVIAVMFAGCSRRQGSVTSSGGVSASASAAPVSASASAATASPASSAPVSADLDSLPSGPSVASLPYPVTSAAPVQDTNANAKKAADLCGQSFTNYNAKNYAPAKQLADEAVQLDPDCYVGYNLKGISMCYLGDVPGGRVLIDKSITMCPTYAYAYFNKAMSFKFDGEYDNSIVCFLKSLSLDPSSAWAYYGISTVYADKNEVQNSLAYLKKAISMNPDVKTTARVQHHYDRMRSNPAFQKLVA